MIPNLIFLLKGGLKKSIYFLLIVPALLVSKNNFAQKSERSYINNDSNAVYSTHPGRPFRYGPAYDYEKGSEYRNDFLKEYNFKKHEVVAEVGAASGWMLGLLSVFTDSVTFYVEDIDTNYLNADQFQKVVKHYTSIRKTPQTNSFHFVIGNFKETKLPEKTFDKVILDNTFHEITEPDAMIDDIITKIKPDGQIIIREKFSNDIRYTYHEGCYIRSYKVSMLQKQMEKRGFYITHMSDPKNAMHNMLVFQKDKLKADAFLEKQKSIEKYLNELDKLNDKNISKDSVKVLKIAIEIKDHLDEIHAVFPSLKSYLSFLGDDYADGKDFIQAANVYRVSTILYPDDAQAYLDVADSYIDARQNPLALKYSQIAVNIKPSMADAYYYRAYSYYLLNDFGQATDDYEKALELDPKNKDIYFDMALMYEDMLDYDQAIQCYSKALKLDSKDGELWLARADIYIASGSYEKAILDCDKALSLDPENGEAYLTRAEAKHYLGDKEGSKTDKEKAKQLNKAAAKRSKPYKRNEVGKFKG